ncbi:sugar nucleotide-binding protein [Streptomyces sp. NPDC048257]|uniref:sugar nucleotide-binding protein n=1 Tax=Streptomyces sp. NPDC048257 TaxID=3365526 RepID=UPI00371F2FF3
MRTSWPYGRDSGGFVHTMVRLAREPGRTVDVVDDRHGRPRRTPDVLAGQPEHLTGPVVPGGAARSWAARPPETVNSPDRRGC